MAKYECDVCGYIFDKEGEGGKWDELEDAWVCPVCDSGKELFKIIVKDNVVDENLIKYTGGKKMTKTEENLKAAFAGESQARNKYDYFAKVADEEGYRYVAKVFRETAINESQHAKDEFKMLNGIGSTVDNLKAAIEGEDYETISMYPEFAKEAEEEGNIEAATLFKQIAKVEKEHRDRYKKLLKRIEDGTVYKRDKPIKWKCAKCGYVHEGEEAPNKCPSCKHPQEYYEPEMMDL